MALHPIYYLVGHDAALKGVVTNAYFTENGDAPLTTAYADVDIYDHDSAVTATYVYTASNTQAPVDTGVTAMDAALVPVIRDQHLSTGFTLVKRSDPGELGGVGANRWLKSHAESWNNIAAADTALRAVITGAGDTPDPLGAWVALGWVQGETLVKTELATFCADLRADYLDSAVAKIVFLMPPKSPPGYSAGDLTARQTSRSVILQLCAEDPNSSYVETDHLVRQTSGDLAGEGTTDLGRIAAAEMTRMVNGRPAVAGRGAPVFCFLGDEMIAGNASSDFLAADADDRYSGDITDAWIWNVANQQWEVLNGATNSNTAGVASGMFGPEVIFAADWLAAHPGERCYIFKYAFPQSALGDPAAPGGSWNPADEDLILAGNAEFSAAMAALVTVQGYLPDVRAITFHVGDRDADTDATAAALSAHLATLEPTLRDDFTSRSYVNASQTPLLTPRSPWTEYWPNDRVRAIRAAQDNLGLAEAVTVLDTDGFRLSTDDRNLAGAGIVQLGMALAAAVD